MDTKNTASGNAKVEAQIGVVQGNATFHRHETIYQVSRDDTPERRFRVALNHLKGGSPRIAEELIGEVLRGGLETTEVAYYYSIAILSERSLNQLGPAEYSAFDHALRVARRHSRDDWLVALDVIGNLMSAVNRQERLAEPDVDGLMRVLDEFKSLPEDRRLEITKHLDMILDGAVQDQMDRLNAELVRSGRIAGDRKKRAPKFFEPDPAEPKRVEPSFHPVDQSGAWTAAGLGGAACAGLFLVAVLAFDMSASPLVVLYALGLLGSGGLAWWFGSQVAAAELRRGRLEHEHGHGRAVGQPESKRGSAGFRTAVSGLVDQEFRDFALWKDVRHKELSEFGDDLRRIRDRLKDRLIRQYGGEVVDPDKATAMDHLKDLVDIDGEKKEKREIPVASLQWLIKWHADRVATRWRNKSLYDFRKVGDEELRAYGAVGLGCLLGLGATVGLVSEASGLAASVACVLAVPALAFGVANAAVAQGGRRAVAREHEDADALHAEERAAYEAEVERLSGRPKDAEMARWLDFDKAHLKTTALQHCGLMNRDIVAQVVLTEGAPRASRARVVHGPPRYSAYVVMVFLLTETGVRVVEYDLDFINGAVSNEERTAFRYDMLTSAKVSEVGVKFAGEGQRVFVIGADRVRVTDKTENMVLSRAFRLSFVNGDDITIVVENFEGLIDTDVEDKSKLVDLALDSSGVAGAMQVLESVAAEGREWIERERERSARRWRDWKAGERRELESGSTPGDDPKEAPDGRFALGSGGD